MSEILLSLSIIGPLAAIVAIAFMKLVLFLGSIPAKIKFPIKYLGHITSSYHSPTLNYYVAMAMIEGGNELIGKKFYVTQNKSLENINVEIVKPIFLDPENKRLLS